MNQIKFNFEPQYIRKICLYHENGIEIELSRANIMSFHVNKGASFNIVQDDKDTLVPSARIELYNVEVEFELHKKANTIYHAFDNYKGKTKVFTRLQKNDITGIKIWYYPSDRNLTVYALFPVQNTKDWWQSNDYQQCKILSNGNMSVSIAMNKKGA